VQSNPTQGLLGRLPGMTNTNQYSTDMNIPDTGKFGSKKTIAFPGATEAKQTVDRGSDPITEEWLMSQNYYAM